MHWKALASFLSPASQVTFPVNGKKGFTGFDITDGKGDFRV